MSIVQARVAVVWRPQPRQAEFMSRPEPEALYGGAAGGGKGDALVIGALTTLVVLPLALALGVAAGYFRGWVDEVIQYVYTLLASIPDVLLIEPKVFGDDRGFFYESSNRSAFGEASGIDVDFVQDNHSKSARNVATP